MKVDSEFEYLLFLVCGRWSWSGCVG